MIFSEGDRMNIDGNTHALNEYEKRVQRFDMIESLFNSELEPIIQQLEDLASQVKSLVTHFEDEYGLDFADDAREAVDEAMR